MGLINKTFPLEGPIFCTRLSKKMLLLGFLEVSLCSRSTPWVAPTEIFWGKFILACLSQLSCQLIAELLQGALRSAPEHRWMCRVLRLQRLLRLRLNWPFALLALLAWSSKAHLLPLNWATWRWGKSETASAKAVESYPVPDCRTEIWSQGSSHCDHGSACTQLAMECDWGRPHAHKGNWP